MLFILIASVILGGAIIYAVESDKGIPLLAAAIFVSAVLLAEGLVANIGGYHDPELIDTQELYPIRYAVQTSDSAPDYYLIIDNTGEEQAYTYCIKVPASYFTDEDYIYDLVNRSDVEVRIGEQPRLEVFQIKPKRNFFSFRIKGELTQYVVTVPSEWINNVYKKGGE